MRLGGLLAPQTWRSVRTGWYSTQVTSPLPPRLPPRGLLQLEGGGKWYGQNALERLCPLVNNYAQTIDIMIHNVVI